METQKTCENNMENIFLQGFDFIMELSTEEKKQLLSMWKGKETCIKQDGN